MTQKKTFEILIANGVNLDLLGSREPDVYGSANLIDLERGIRAKLPLLEKWFQVQLNLSFYQSNHEGAFLGELSRLPWDGVILNAGAWTHSSLALADRLKALRLPFVEVHISNLAKREAFRHHSYSAPHAQGVVYGFGLASYMTGLFGLLNQLATP